ncbi:MAG: hypothetical protein J4G04_00575 [Nitrosopumilaceae archaeon]|nr:hypothetical protein [Nitrosopumilaceae archaeon]
MIEEEDARKVAAALAGNLRGVSLDAKNFAGLPDEFWGYYARGHDSKGAFCMVVMYSGDEKDVDSTIHAYEEWLAGRRSAGLHE